MPIESSITPLLPFLIKQQISQVANQPIFQTCFRFLPFALKYYGLWR